MFKYFPIWNETKLLSYFTLIKFCTISTNGKLSCKDARIWTGNMVEKFKDARLKSTNINKHNLKYNKKFKK